MCSPRLATPWTSSTLAHLCRNLSLLERRKACERSGEGNFWKWRPWLQPCLSAPWFPGHLKGVSRQNHSHKVTHGLQGAPRAQLLAVGQDTVQWPLCPFLKGQEAEPTIGYFPVST